MNNHNINNVDIVLKQLSYLPFNDVISACQSNSLHHKYCTDPSYSLKWKSLIFNTFKDIDGYDDKIIQIQRDLYYFDQQRLLDQKLHNQLISHHEYNQQLQQLQLKENYDPNRFDYLIYVKLVKKLDPITQLMIYYRQQDWKSFHKNFNNHSRLLAMFLLNNKVEAEKYYNLLDIYGKNLYQGFINYLNQIELNQNEKDYMLIEMAKYGNLRGVKMMINEGVNLHAQDDYALILASKYGHLEVVKYLIEKGANLHAQDDEALSLASRDGHLEVVKYLIEQGANLHAQDDDALSWASRYGNLEVVKYLIEKGADIHAQDDTALKKASQNCYRRL